MFKGRIARFDAPGMPFEVETVSLPEVGAGQILIKVSRTNICGSDLHAWHGTFSTGGLGGQLPTVLGHEMVGAVEEEPQPGVFDDTYLASVEQTVQTLANHGIVSLLDFHQQLGPAWADETGGIPSANLPFPLSVFFDPANNHALDQFWANATDLNGVGGLENDYAQMVEHVANAFNGNPNVLGIEIMNEPEPGNQIYPSIFGSPFFEGQELTPFYDQVSSAIRAVDPTTPIFYEPSILATAEAPIHLGTVDASNTVLSFHDYCFVNISPLGCLPDVTTIEQNAEAYAQAHDIPAFMSEFGSTSNQSSLIDTMQPANQNLIGWTEWAYGGNDQVDTGVDGTPPSLVQDLSQRRPATMSTLPTWTHSPSRTRRWLPAPRHPSRLRTALSSSATPPRWLTARVTSAPARRPRSRYRPSSFRTATR